MDLKVRKPLKTHAKFQLEFNQATWEAISLTQHLSFHRCWVSFNDLIFQSKMAGKWDRDLKQIQKKNIYQPGASIRDPTWSPSCGYHQISPMGHVFFTIPKTVCKELPPRTRMVSRCHCFPNQKKSTVLSIRVTTTSNYTNRKFFLQKLGELKCHSKTLCGKSQLSFPTRFEPWVLRWTAHNMERIQSKFDRYCSKKTKSVYTF